MRPGRIRPGNLVDPGVTTRKANASMRPGRIRPGNAKPGDYLRYQLIHASMRPGRIRPGNCACGSSHVSVWGCFNEAGADPPRKHRGRFVSE